MKLLVICSIMILSLSSSSFGETEGMGRVLIGKRLSVLARELLGNKLRPDGEKSVHIGPNGGIINERDARFYTLKNAQVMIELEFNKEEEVTKIRWVSLKSNGAQGFNSEWREAAEISFDKIKFKALDSKPPLEEQGEPAKKRSQ